MKLHVAEQAYDVQYIEDPQIITRKLEEENPPFFTYDTETSGLHIKKDKAFLGAICFNHKVFVFPAKPEILNCLPRWSEMVKRVYMHNATFDLHMTANIVGDETVLAIKNVGDTQGLARLSFESLSTRDGGHRLALKYIGRKFIDPDADQWEKSVKMWLSQEAKARRKVLLTMLKPFGILAKQMDEVLKDEGTFEDPDMQEIYEAWQQDYPPVTYQDVPMEIMLPYVAVDVILTQQLVYMALKVVVTKKQIPVMEREFKLIPVVYKMERQGVAVDLPYLDECKVKMKEYMAKLYEELRELTQMESLKVGQHAVIKKMYEDWLKEELQSSNKQFLNRMTREYKESKEGRVAWLISSLRRLEKWLKTYIVRIRENASYDGRFYTQLNQFSPVSGRFSGDSQQFPKEDIKDEKDNQIYHPRKAFRGTMYYLDYSQVELRVQGHYTLKFGGDLNLCRAYMPFQCRHYQTGEQYSFENARDRKRWIELREGFNLDAFIKEFFEKNPNKKKWEMEDVFKDGWSVWLTEDGKPWTPTDVHGATTVKALEIMGNTLIEVGDWEAAKKLDRDEMSEEEFHAWRYTGKRFNFMRNYGGGDKKAAETLEITLEAAQAMNKGYSEAFPKVLEYQRWVEDVMRNQSGYIEHQLGRRYYITDSWRYYKVGNYMIQGLCADYLKEKMIEIDEYLEKHDLWKRLPMILCIHDELQFENKTGDPELEKHIWVIKEMMEDTPDILLPIVAEVEKTTTNWAEKKALH